MDDYFFQIYSVLTLVMVLALCAFSVSITEKQMNSKDKEGKITFNKFQNAMVLVFRWALYGMLVTAGYTIGQGVSKWLIT